MWPSGCSAGCRVLNHLLWLHLGDRSRFLGKHLLISHTALLSHLGLSLQMLRALKRHCGCRAEKVSVLHVWFLLQSWLVKSWTKFSHSFSCNTCRSSWIAYLDYDENIHYNLRPLACLCFFLQSCCLRMIVFVILDFPLVCVKTNKMVGRACLHQVFRVSVTLNYVFPYLVIFKFLDKPSLGWKKSYFTKFSKEM